MSPNPAVLNKSVVVDGQTNEHKGLGAFSGIRKSDVQLIFNEKASYGF